MKVYSWGRAHPGSSASILKSRQLESKHAQTTLYGNGRSYGDSCLNSVDGVTVTGARDKFISFNAMTGLLKCESGILLGTIQRSLVPRGWILPVSPGTQFVTVGGAVANDIHGKNHSSMGCLGNHIADLTLSRTDSGETHCSSRDNSALFEATIGGLGLTGLITDVSIQMKRVKSSMLEVENLAFSSLDEFYALSEESTDFEYAVAWIDGSKPSKKARGIFSRGNHASEQPAAERNIRERTINFPITPPFSLISPLTMKVFNEAYFQRGKHGPQRSCINYSDFLYPLDKITNWNRVYGRRGFMQYQLVIPECNAMPAITEIINEIYAAKAGSVLSVLKTFGDRRSPGLLSFPMAGTTLAMDFPNRGNETLKLFEKLDHIVSLAKGRLYPAKDSRMSAKMFHEGYPNTDRFQNFRDPYLTSDFAKRIFEE